VVEHRQVFGQPHRVVQRRQQRGDRDGDALGGSGQRRCEHYGRRQKTLLGHVVLRHGHDVDAEPVGPTCLVESGAVEGVVTHAADAVGCGPEVVAQRDQRHRVALPVGPQAHWSVVTASLAQI
jgi:hypothetical protein